MAGIASFKYRAFLSYSHRDAGWAKWLHARLEGFRFDKDLVGRETPLGPVPKTLRPIFHDREDFSGGHSLTDATIAAIDASAALIVLCSLVAARLDCWRRRLIRRGQNIFAWRSSKPQKNGSFGCSDLKWR